MSVNWVDISGDTSHTPWGTILEVLADCIKEHIDPAASGARVYPYWIYEIDINTMLGKTVDAMKATDGTSNKKVHCWTLGIESAQYVLNPQTGELPEIGGVSSWEWLLVINVWGFWDYDRTRASQNKALNEARLVSAALTRNANAILEDTDNKISQIGHLQFSAVSPTPFSNSELISVASGSMQVRVRESLQI